MYKLTTRFWIVLALALAFIAVDSAARLHAIHAATEARFTPALTPEPDATSPSGYAGNQHRVFAPVEGIDGDHWIMQTQQMLYDRTLRVRHVDYDGPPEGRDVHWSSALRWATAGVAQAASIATGRPPAESIELVSPWVNTLLLCILLAILAPLLGCRFGVLPACAFVVACTTAYPFYQLFEVGILDHHGLAAVCALCTALFVVAGGAGWVRSDTQSLDRGGARHRALLDWLPSHEHARRWFIASGVAGGAGLWINAATQIPALIGIGIAAVIGVAVARTSHNASWQLSPNLWRTWGLAGGATSLALFAVEYLPNNISMHLEVNHPLHAVAWVAAGDALARLYGASHPRRAMWLALDAVAVAAVPVMMIALPDSFALRPGSLILRLHEQYITEFQGLFALTARWSWPQISASVGLLPIVMLWPVVAIGLSSRVQAPLRASVITTAIPAVLFTVMSFEQMRWFAIAVALWSGALVVVVFVLTISSTNWSSNAPRRVIVGVAIAAIFAIVPLLMLRHTAAGAGMRPFMFLTLAVAVLASSQIARGLSEWSNTRLLLSGVAAGIAVWPSPISVAYTWLDKGWSYRATASDVAQIMTRDIAYMLRARLGATQGTVLGGPTTSTWMTYYGGMRSVATFYWENSEGITLAARILGATNAPDGHITAADSAHKLIEVSGITHIVLCSWDAMAVDYAAIAPNASASGDPFAQQLVKGKIPAWLRPVPFELPKLPYFANPWVWIFEVVPNQTKDEEMVRLGQYYLATKLSLDAVTPIKQTLSAHPHFLPALIHLANAQFALPEAGDVHETMRRIRSDLKDTVSLAFEDDVFLAFAFALDADSVQAHQALVRALAKADESAVRRLAPDNAKLTMVELARRLGLERDPRGAVELAMRLLPAGSPTKK